MKRIAVVVHRCGREIVGGSEGYAFKMAESLSEEFNVDVITTTAKDYVTWENFYKEGAQRVSGALRILRFGVDIQRGPYWHGLSRVLFKNLSIEKFATLEPERKESFLSELEKTPLGLQEEWIKFQGPHSSGLIQYIKENNSRYDAFIFVTYLYPTTYFAVDAVRDSKKVFIVPTLHDEPPAYLPIFKKYSAFSQLFLTGAEKAFAGRVLKSQDGSAALGTGVLGFGIEDRFEAVEKSGGGAPYILYAGRLDEAKGVRGLFEYFRRFSKKDAGLKLYTIGDGELKSYRHERVEYLGFVSEEEKLSLMKNALALVHPSPYESLAISLLESFMMETPALVNGKCAVLKDHIESSRGGFAYGSYDEFETHLSRLMGDRALKRRLGRNARGYFLENYSLEKYKERLLSIFRPVPDITGEQKRAPSFQHELSAMP
ncbi:MAG: glycosyltransferase family 4 protein [Thermodesulfobacteriota bacterium]